MAEKEETVLPQGGKEEKEQGQGQEEKEDGLKPWEQHSAVISIPRYDYKAPSSILESSHSGFLITCAIKREKSATKEAIAILEQYLDCIGSNGCGTSEPCDRNVASKRRKICFEGADGEHGGIAEGNGDSNRPGALGEVAKEACLPSPDIAENGKSSLNLSLVKLSRSGLLLFTFPSKDCRHVVDILSNIFLSLESGTLKRPLWCHRIFPVEGTCILIEKDLQIVVSKLVQGYFGNEQDKLERPIKFAVGYNRRGIEETAMKIPKITAEDSKRLPLLDRDKCFQVVAGAFKEVAKNSVVDLKSPEVVVLVELLPISGVPHESLVVGVSVLPQELITTKPRLSVKSLISDAKVPKTKG